MMSYQAKNFSQLLGLKGFSDQALETHFKLYQGYVDNTNQLLEKLKEKSLDSIQRAEIRRRLGWEFNGMRLHEIYFSSLSPSAQSLDKNSKLARQIKKSFGSFEKWRQDFQAAALSRGIGWAILYWDQPHKKLINFWIEQHHSGHPAGLTPLVALDMFEHAFLIDYGTDKGKYAEAFWGTLDYEKINLRMEKS